MNVVDLDERNEGTLTNCKCGREFFLSFQNGFMCEACKRKNIVENLDQVIKDTLKKYLDKD